MEKICKNCDYYVNNYGYGQCYGQKNAPQVDDNEHCEDWKEYSGKEKKNMTDRIKQAVADEFKYRASQGRPIFTMEEVIYIVNEIIDEVEFENK